MKINLNIALLLSNFIVVATLLIAWFDFSQRKIKNMLLILFVAGGVVIHGLEGNLRFIQFMVMHVLPAIAVFLIFLIFYRAKWMGAGDVKLAAAIALVAGVGPFGWGWLLSVPLTLVYMAVRPGKPGEASALGKAKAWSKTSRYVPYGGILAMACAFVTIWQAMGM